MNANINNDEIDILEIFKSIISFIKKSYKILLGAILIGLTIGYSIYFVIPPYYESQIGFYSENLSDRKLFSLMLDLEKFLLSKDYKVLGRKMHLSEASIKKIKKMKVSAVEEEIGDVNSSDVKDNGILVTFTVLENNLFDSLELGLKHYIENTSFVKSRLDLYKSSLIYNKDKLDKEISDLDSMKMRLTTTITKGGKSNLFISDIGNIGSKLVEFYEKRSDLANQIELVSDIRVFKNFSKYNKKAGPKLLIYLFYSTFISLFFGILLYFYPRIREFILKA
jgi:hypothetical protein